KRPAREGGLPLARHCNRVRGTLEGDEEGIALVVDLVAVIPLEQLAQDPPVLGEHVAIALRPQLVEEPRRALDVREEQSQASRRQIGHERIMRRTRGYCFTRISS